MKNKRALAVVYTHSLDGVVFYVGYSKRHRSSSRHKDFRSRTKPWKEFAKGREPQVALYYFNDCLMAERAEMLMIYKYRDTVVNVINANNRIKPNPLGYKDGYMRESYLPL